MMERYKHIIGGKPDEYIDKYVSSIDFDKNIVKYVAMVMLVHVKELARENIMPIASVKVIVNELVKIIESDGKILYDWIKNRNEKYEDVFEALELYLHNIVGKDAGYIAIGRSRNDHIATVLRLAIRDKIIEILFKLLEIRKKLIDKGLRYRDTIFPYFTHAQVAQCSSASIYFLSYEQTFSDITTILYNVLELLNQNPLGSGAAVGTFLQLDFGTISRELCLSPKLLPPYYATGSRLFLLHTATILSLLMSEIGRFVEDIMLLLATIPQGLEIPKSHISTSSIMPHKRNPVTLEIVRAKVSKIIGILTTLLSAYKSLPYGYNLDFQEMNIYFFEMIKEVIGALVIIEDIIEKIELNSSAITKYISDKPCWSSDVIEHIAIKENKPVRELYIEIARAFQAMAEGDDTALNKFFMRHITELKDLWDILKLKPIEKKLDDLIDHAKKRVDEDAKRVKQLHDCLNQCNEMLIRNFAYA